MNMHFQGAYAPSGNGGVERSHRTVKVIAARKGCSIAEAVYPYNITPRDDCLLISRHANMLKLIVHCVTIYMIYVMIYNPAFLRHCIRTEETTP